MLSPPPPIYKVVKNFLTVEDLYARYAPQYLKVDDLFRMFGRRSARSSTAPRPTSMRHRGRRLAEKGDGSTNIPKHRIKQQLNQQNLKPKNPFPLLTRTPLQPVLYKLAPPLQRSRSTSCLMAICPMAPRLTATPHCFPPHASSVPKLTIPLSIKS